MFDDRRHEGRAVAHLGHDDAPGVTDEPRQPLPDERRILGDDDPERLDIHASMMHQRFRCGRSIVPDLRALSGQPLGNTVVILEPEQARVPPSSQPPWPSSAYPRTATTSP